MIECPYCAKKSRNNFSYCRICGTELSGGSPGDYSTEMLNIFKHGDEYLYLFAENGNQVVLRASSMEELAGIVEEKKYPWEFKDWKNNISHFKRETVKIQLPKTEFLIASSLKEPEIIPTASTKKKQADESYVPEYKVERVVEE